jgi:hypothetical protein
LCHTIRSETRGCQGYRQILAKKRKIRNFFRVLLAFTAGIDVAASLSRRPCPLSAIKSTPMPMRHLPPASCHHAL